MSRKTFEKLILFTAAVSVMLTLLCASCAKTAGNDYPQTTQIPSGTTEVPDPVPTEAPATDVPSDGTDFEIRFKDNFFHEAVCSYLGKGRYDPIYLSDVEHLTRFSARVCRISDITEISYFRDLEDLDLYGNAITDLSPIQTLTNIKTLNISRIFTLMDGADKRKGLDLAPVGKLINIESLDASGNLISDISPLSGLTSLVRLDLKNNRITDASPLSTLVNLRWLDISDNIAINYDTNDEQGISDLLFANGMKELTYLNAYNNTVESLKGLEGARKLETLDIRYNYVKSLDPLMMSDSLVTLYASNNNITSVAGLYGCSKLKSVNVDNNLMTEISTVILYLPSLTDFSFNGNRITESGVYFMWKSIRGE